MKNIAELKRLKYMRKLITLFLLSCLCFGFTDRAMAQAGRATKTRYVYLWDVTASTKTKKVNGRFVFDVMADFLREDIARKADGTEIVIVPFNDGQMSAISFKKGARNVGDIITEGNKWTKDHYEAWKDAKKRYAERSGKGLNSSKGEILGAEYKGFTDIAGTLNAAHNYVSPSYNTIFILLTDCGQEYVNNRGEKVNTGNDAAQAYLCSEIRAMNSKMCEYGDNQCFNRLFYVIADVNDNPCNVDAGLNNLEKVEFIDPSKGSIQLYFEQLKVSAENKDVSYLDKSLDVRFEDVNNKSILHNYNNKIKVDVEAHYFDKEGIRHDFKRRNLTLDLRNSSVTIDNLDFESKASDLEEKTEVEFKISLTKETEEYFESISDKFVRVWLSQDATTVGVTKDFAPILRVKKHR